MRRVWITLLSAVLFCGVVQGLPVWAQVEVEGTPGPAFSLYTAYPAQVIGIGESVTLPLRLRAPAAQIVQLETRNLPENWTATFRGANRIVQSVYVQPDAEATVDLRLEPPAGATAGTYHFTVVASGASTSAELPISLTIKEKVPAKLAFEVELPTLRGRPNTTFRYDVTLKNEGDEDLNVTLSAETPPSFQVTYKLNAQEVTDLPLAANESKRLSVEAQPLSDIPAGNYTFTLRAQSDEATADAQLAAEVTGQPNLLVTAPDGRLSGEAYAGTETPFKVIVQNSGTAPVRQIEMSASNPGGWSVEFDPKQIDEIVPGQQTEVTARIKPADKAVAGDYIVSIIARPTEGSSKSVDFRVTVLTSTLWGIVGVGLIAVAVGVVGLAVSRFGRR